MKSRLCLWKHELNMFVFFSLGDPAPRCPPPRSLEKPLMGGIIMQTGELVVRVYATAAQLPLEGATVVVTTKEENGKFSLISLQKTDRSGMTEPILVPTPDTIDSTQQNPPECPYRDCEVWAEHPGFLVQRVEGVQVFPGVTTRQDMELIPLGEGEHPLG